MQILSQKITSLQTHNNSGNNTHTKIFKSKLLTPATHLELHQNGLMEEYTDTHMIKQEFMLITDPTG